MKALGTVVVLFGWLIAMIVVLAPAASPCLADKIHVAPPPPPPPTDAKPAQTFDYQHTVKKVDRNRKLVVALLRTGDLVALKDYLPFGRSGVINAVTLLGGTVPVFVFQADAPVFMPPPVRQFLTRELLDTGEFLVIERERIVEIVRELEFAKTQAVNPDTAPRPGYLVGVHYIIEGSYYPIAGLPDGDPALVAAKKDIARRGLNLVPQQACIMYLTVYKVETGETKAVACGVGLQPLEAVKRAVEDLVDQLGAIAEPIKVVKVDPDTGMAVLDIGSGNGVKPGDAFTLAPADAGTGAGVKAEVVKTDLLSSVVKVAPADKAAVKEGEVATPVAAPPSVANPAAGPPAPTAPAPTK